MRTTKFATVVLGIVAVVAISGCGGGRPAGVEIGLKDKDGSALVQNDGPVSVPVEVPADDHGVTAAGIEWQLVEKPATEAVPTAEVVERLKSWRSYTPFVDDKFERKGMLFDWKPAVLTRDRTPPVPYAPSEHVDGQRASIHVGGIVRLEGGERRIARKHIVAIWVTAGPTRHMVVAFGPPTVELSAVEREAECVLLDHIFGTANRR